MVEPRRRVVILHQCTCCYADYESRTHAERCCDCDGGAQEQLADYEYEMDGRGSCQGSVDHRHPEKKDDWGLARTVLAYLKARTEPVGVEVIMKDMVLDEDRVRHALRLLQSDFVIHCPIEAPSEYVYTPDEKKEEK